jgi:hypothetical protein
MMGASACRVGNTRHFSHVGVVRWAVPTLLTDQVKISQLSQIHHGWLCSGLSLIGLGKVII